MNFISGFLKVFVYLTDVYLLSAGADIVFAVDGSISVREFNFYVNYLQLVADVIKRTSLSPSTFQAGMNEIINCGVE